MDPFLAQAQAAGESPMQRAIRILSVYFPQLQQTLGQDFYTQHHLTWGPLPTMEQPPAPPTLPRPTREQARSILQSRGLLQGARRLAPQGLPPQPPPRLPEPSDARAPQFLGPPVTQDDQPRRRPLVD